MEENLRKLVKENTIHEKYKLNNASQLGTQLGLSRNWISQYLNEYYNDGTFIKINTRPVVFLDREALEEKYSIRVDKNLLTSFDELRTIIQGQISVTVCSPIERWRNILIPFLRNVIILPVS